MSDDPMVAVLCEHRQSHRATDGASECRCGNWTGPYTMVGPRSDSYAAHLADVLRAAGYIHRDEQEASA